VILAKARLICILYFFDSSSSRVYCDNATKLMCVANVIFGQERLTEQFLSMHFFYDSVILFTKWCSSPTEHLTFHVLFLRQHSFSAPEGVETERQWAAPGEDSWNGQTWQDPLWNFKQEMALTLGPPPQVYCSSSSAPTNVIIRSV